MITLLQALYSFDTTRYSIHQFIYLELRWYFRISNYLKIMSCIYFAIQDLLNSINYLLIQYIVLIIKPYYLRR